MVIPFVIESLKKIFENEPSDEESSILPLKIIQNFYMDHSDLVKETIHELSLHILRYIFNYS